MPLRSAARTRTVHTGVEPSRWVQRMSGRVRVGRRWSPRRSAVMVTACEFVVTVPPRFFVVAVQDRKSTRLNSSHMSISYAVFCLKKKNAAYPDVVDDDRVRFRPGREPSNTTSTLAPAGP